MSYKPEDSLGGASASVRGQGRTAGTDKPTLSRVCVLSHVRLCATPWTVAHQAPLSMGFSRQEHWSGVQFPSPGDFPNPGIEPMSPALAGRFFTTEPHGKPMNVYEALLKPWSTLLLYTWTSLVNDNLAITCGFSKGNDPVFEPFVYTVFYHRKHNASRFVYKQDLYQRHPPQ